MVDQPTSTPPPNPLLESHQNSILSPGNSIFFALFLHFWAFRSLSSSLFGNPVRPIWGSQHLPSNQSNFLIPTICTHWLLHWICKSNYCVSRNWKKLPSTQAAKFRVVFLSGVKENGLAFHFKKSNKYQFTKTKGMTIKVDGFQNIRRGGP